MEQPNFEAMSHFVAVARHGGLNAASRETGVPKATISRHVRQLEVSLGTLLLERGGRRMQMTEDGRILFARAAPFSQIWSQRARRSVLGTDGFAAACGLAFPPCLRGRAWGRSQHHS
ncbi:LysR family transcriptional regulator [Hoeflea sp. G2-23]|uniref:LysR family transcriptional regulator n=1 Tax=Hoeflea algicola TaxID=2983763 RepID=A0ABT3Z8P5_9HYPH|nr:LysR family transcriptional regulator [Hoeflea algicola]MCY0147651.1 LysR family transcriptional regulator [Hoeflea algicola]